jgi:hypothetical protein
LSLCQSIVHGGEYNLEFTNLLLSFIPILNRYTTAVSELILDASAVMGTDIPLISLIVLAIVQFELFNGLTDSDDPSRASAVNILLDLTNAT